MADNHQDEQPDAASRRTVLRGALIAGVAAPLLAACASKSGDASSASGTGGGGGAGSGGGSSAGSGGSGGGAATALAKTTAIPEGSGKIFGDEGVVVTQPKPGDFKGFTNICTHMGCPVHDVTSTINCTCHGSQYSITDGSVVTGPATQPLAPKPLKVSGKEISLA
jgi:nitrite reductase/ring-hydroxylating ferredoxin subunit